MVVARNEAGIYKKLVIAWVVEFQRKYKGYTFVDQDTINLHLDPRDGVLLKFESRFPSPLPTSLEIAVTKKKAVEIATDHIKKNSKLNDLIQRSAKLMIVPVFSKQDSQRPTESRLAWTVHFNWDGTHVADAWVDAKSGEVLFFRRCS